MKTMTIAALLVLLAACGVSEKAFPARSAAVTCQRAQECEKASFDVVYSSLADCKKTVGDQMQVLFDQAGDRCNWDGGLAAQCLAWARSASCDDFVNGTNVDASCNDYCGGTTGDTGN